MRLHIHGVHVPNRKNTAELAALRLPIPETVEIPMSMHIGAPAIPVVKPGDSVRVGQLIGKAGGFVSAPVYASVSGTVKKIGQQVGSGGRLMQTVVIAADGKQEPDPELQPPKLETMQDFLDAVRASGMVGLGGAGFPTVVKLTVKNLEQVQAVIINGAECEPYITSDTRTMLDRSDELMEGARGAASRAIEAFGPIDASEWNHLKNDVRESVQRYVYDTIKRNPMILPIIVEI